MNDTERNLFLAEALVGGGPFAIEQQEARGQQAVCRAQRVPHRICNQAEWEALGLKFGERVDDLFCEVELPSGWHIEPTDHSMWNRIVDDKGRGRGTFFYKAAFYDRDAFMHAPSTYHTLERDNGEGDEQHALVKTADGEVLFTSNTFKRSDYPAMDAAQEQCVAWLDENRPEWRNSAAYWPA